MNDNTLRDDYEAVPIRPAFHVIKSTPVKHNFTYADYLSWDDGVRRELIDGEAYEMAAPTSRHQVIDAILTTSFTNYLHGKTCMALPAPFDVRLYAPVSAEEDRQDDHYVVQPDLSVICDRKKLHKDGCHGAPDLIIEIVSQGDKDHDTRLKFGVYREAGVREYWIIDPYDKTLTVYTLDKDAQGSAFYKAQVYGPEDQVKVGILENLTIDLAEIFNMDEAGLPLPAK